MATISSRGPALKQAIPPARKARKAIERETGKIDRDDGLRREKQLLIDFPCAPAEGPLVYVGRDMKTTHVGMGISENDWDIFRTHLEATLEHFAVPSSERAD